MSNSLRLDVALRLWGLAPSRAKAQELLQEGAVELLTNTGWISVTDDSMLVREDQRNAVRLIDTKAIEFVSRGGRKLEDTLAHFKINVENLKVLDVGISTGGFTDCLLAKGAVRV